MDHITINAPKWGKLNFLYFYDFTTIFITQDSISAVWSFILTFCKYLLCRSFPNPNQVGKGKKKLLNTARLGLPLSGTKG
jgi:hypothetical protein